MMERRVDHETRKRVAQMSPEEMRLLLLTSEKTGLPNRRAFEEADATPFVAMADVNGLKRLNDQFGYAAGDALIRRFATLLAGAGLDAYHDKGDEFLFRGCSREELEQKLRRVQHVMRTQSFVITSLNGECTTIEGADFCFGIGTTQQEAESCLKQQKRLKGNTRTGSSSYPSQRTPSWPFSLRGAIQEGFTFLRKPLFAASFGV